MSENVAVKVAVPAVGVPVTLREGRGRLVRVFLGSLLLTVASLVAASHPGDAPPGRGWLGWVGVVLFGLGSVVLGVLLVGGGRTLRLDTDGIVASTGLGRNGQRLSWRDIATFGTHRVSRRKGTGTLVAYELRSGASGAFPTVYGGMSATAIAAYLEQWRQAAVNASEP
jgi:hypothetical protein